MVVGHHVERVVGHLIHLQALYLVVRHVVECHTYVVTEERVAVEPHLFYAAPHVCQLASFVAKAWQTAHEVEQYRTAGRLVSIGIEEGCVATLIHLLKFAHHLGFGKGHGGRLQDHGVELYHELVAYHILVGHWCEDAVVGLHTDI